LSTFILTFVGFIGLVKSSNRPAPGGTYATEVGLDSDIDNSVIQVDSVAPVNNPPIANNDLVSTPVDTSITIDIKLNDFDPESQPISIASVDTTSAQGGTIVNNGNDVTYTPPTGFSGTDTFTYTITDGPNTSNVATVTVSVGSEIGIYVSCDGSCPDKVLRFKLDGTFVDEFVAQGIGGLSSPYAAVFGPNGDLYVTNDGAGNVLRYDATTGDPKPTSGKTGAIFVDGVNQVRGIIFDSSDVMYVTSGDLLGGVIKKFNGNTGASLGIVQGATFDNHADIVALLQLQGLAFAGPNDYLHLLSSQGDKVTRWNVSTGAFVPRDRKLCYHQYQDQNYLFHLIVPT